jgi:hypothetical protein
MHIGRNDPCPCGSGRKYKKCCLGKNAVMPLYQKLLLAMIGLIVVVSSVIVVTSLRNHEPSSARPIWSEEHRHWHRAQ